MDTGRDRIAMLWAVGIVAVMLVGGTVGFVLLPSQRGQTLWDSVCLAIGLPVAARPPGASPPPVSPSSVAWTGKTYATVLAGNAAAGKAIAQPCDACHGANGVGTSDAFPNLAAQVPDAIYKQLVDFKTGKRVNPLMSPLAQPLDDRQMADLAAHYASLVGPVPQVRGAPSLVTMGDPLRNIAPCASCHGGYGVKEGAPSLAGQKAPYLRAQLEAFAKGQRRNDINAQMRTIAVALTPQEIEQLAGWYALQR
jgi:cytochrome c553